MDRDLCNLYSLLGSRFLVHGQLFEFVQDLPSFQHFAKHSVLSVQMRCRSECDEELASIRAWTFVCHAHNPSRVVPQRRPNLILEELVRRVEDGGRSFRFWIRSRTSTLNHEVGNHAVEWASIVERRGAEGEEVFCCLGDRLAEDLKFDVAARGVQLCLLSQVLPGRKRAHKGPRCR